MKDLVGISTTFVAQRSLETGDELNEANIEEVFQSAADRAQYLVVHMATVENILGASGIEKIRAVTSSAGLKALTGMASGDVALITFASVSTAGLYVFKAGSLLGADVASWAYDATSGTGTWFRVESPLMVLGGQGGNQPRLNTDRIRAPNSIIADDFVSTSSPGSTNYTFDGSGYQDTNLESSTLSVAEGDKVTVHAEAKQLYINDALTVQAILMASENGGAYAEIAHSHAWFVTEPALSTGLGVPLHLMARVTVGSGVTSLSFKLRLRGANGSTVTMYRPARIHSLAIRP